MIQLFTNQKNNIYIYTYKLFMNKSQIHFLLFFQNDFLKNTVIEEILRERTNYNSQQKKQRDFWILVSPSFLLNNGLQQKIENSNYFFEKNLENIGENSKYIAIISYKLEFINWIKLILGFFESLNNFNENNEKKKFRSNGIYGVIENKKDINSNSNILEFSYFKEKFNKI